LSFHQTHCFFSLLFHLSLLFPRVQKHTKMALKLNTTPRRAIMTIGACPFPGRLAPTTAVLAPHRRRLSSSLSTTPSSSIVHSIASSSASSASPAPRRVPSLAPTARRSSITAAAAAAAASSPSRGLVQHKAEAKVFYRFLSVRRGRVFPFPPTP